MQEVCLLYVDSKTRPTFKPKTSSLFEVKVEIVKVMGSWTNGPFPATAFDGAEERLLKLMWIEWWKKHVFLQLYHPVNSVLMYSL